VAEVAGRREEHKRATRQALQQAADRLFASQGYAATTVRDIAAAAGVTERTFFRYFAGKEELIIDDALGWLPVLQERVRQRPGSEDPVTALRRSVLEVSAMLASSPRPTPLWLFTDGPPGARITRRTPGAVLRAEAGLAEVIRERLDQAGYSPVVDDDTPIEPEYLAGILARTTLALIRSALIRGWQLREAGQGDQAAGGELIDQAFNILNVPLGAGAPADAPAAGR
jgi:AcrR family transcriptional regulator